MKPSRNERWLQQIEAQIDNDFPDASDLCFVVHVSFDARATDGSFS
jgi:hypothetical protein